MSEQIGKLKMRGLYPATVAVYAEDMSIDIEATRKHLDSIASTPGVKGLVVTGMLAEVLELTPAEEVALVKLACEVRREGQLVIAGIMERNVDKAVAQAQDLKAAGADAFLVFPPYELRAYRKLLSSQDQMMAYFERLDEVGLSIIIFQYPVHSGCAYPVAVLKKLATLPNVVGIKAATGTFEAYKEVWDALKDDLSVLAAVDSPPLRDMLLYGSHGALIGISTITPANWVELVDLAFKKNEKAADAVFDKVCRPLMAAVFENQLPKRAASETACVKEALVQLGEIPSARIRSPAVPVDEGVAQEIRQALFSAGLLPVVGEQNPRESAQPGHAEASSGQP